MEPVRNERSLGELFGDLSQSTATLIRQEMLLARTEIADKVARVGKDAAFVGVGGAVLYAALLGLMITIILVLIRIGAAPWVAAALTTALFGIVGAVLVQTRLNSLRRQPLAPAQTIDSVKETAQWLKNETR